MSTFVRLSAFLVGIGLITFGLLVTMVYVEEVPNLTLRELDLLDHPNLWDQYLGMSLGVAFMVQGAAVSAFGLICFRGEQLSREVWAQKRANHRWSTGRFRHVSVWR